jgi:hypothetical protein
MQLATDKTKVGQRSPHDELIATKSLHPSWHAFIRYCADLRHGEIELLKIQDGLPVLAEVVREKVKFTS